MHGRSHKGEPVAKLQGRSFSPQGDPRGFQEANQCHQLLPSDWIIPLPLIEHHLHPVHQVEPRVDDLVLDEEVRHEIEHLLHVEEHRLQVEVLPQVEQFQLLVGGVQKDMALEADIHQDQEPLVSVQEAVQGHPTPSDQESVVQSQEDQSRSTPCGRSSLLLPVSESPQLETGFQHLEEASVSKLPCVTIPILTTVFGLCRQVSWPRHRPSIRGIGVQKSTSLSFIAPEGIHLWRGRIGPLRGQGFHQASLNHISLGPIR